MVYLRDLNEDMVREWTKSFENLTDRTLAVKIDRAIKDGKDIEVGEYYPTNKVKIV